MTCSWKPKVMHREPWEAIHRPHLTVPDFPIEKVTDAPDYTILALVCPCGAKYIYHEEGSGPGIDDKV